jgi:hypothetical protein
VKACRWWPTGDGYVRVMRVPTSPSTGELCDECVAKARKRK